MLLIHYHLQSLRKINMDKYKRWIASYTGEVYCKCVEVSNMMKEAFPELIIVQGYVRIWEDPLNERPHQWLKTSDDYIIDPTARQWLGIISYREYKEGQKIPKGKCPNCGNQIYCLPTEEPPYLCSDKCHDEYVKYCS